MLVSSFNLSQSFKYTPYLFYKKTVQIRDQFFLFMDPIWPCLLSTDLGWKRGAGCGGGSMCLGVTAGVQGVLSVHQSLTVFLLDPATQSIPSKQEEQMRRKVYLLFPSLCSYRNRQFSVLCWPPADTNNFCSLQGFQQIRQFSDFFSLLGLL